MGLPHSDSGAERPSAVLIPLRSLRDGKLRLSGTYDLEERTRLIESMATRVLAAAHELDVLIVHDGPEVAAWAKSKGAQSLRQSTPGLNRAIAEGRDHLREAGYGRVIVAHADLPHADDLRSVDADTGVVIVPDRHRDGTNVLSIPTTLDFTFAYGPGSFASHLAVSRQLGIEPQVLDRPALAWDVDHPDDLLTEPQL